MWFQHNSARCHRADATLEILHDRFEAWSSQVGVVSRKDLHEHLTCWPDLIVVLTTQLQKMRLLTAPVCECHQHKQAAI